MIHEHNVRATFDRGNMSQSKISREGSIGRDRQRQWGRTRLPKFKFSANFPIALHVILQLQIKKFQNA